MKKEIFIDLFKAMVAIVVILFLVAIGHNRMRH